MSDVLKDKDQNLKEVEESLASTNSKLSSAELKVAKLESGKSELVRQYEVQAQGLKEKLRNQGISPEAKRATSTINRLNKELLKQREELHQSKKTKEDSEVKLKITSGKKLTLEKQNKELTTRLQSNEKQLSTYQQQLRRANRMVTDLERSSQALVSRLESELMRDKRLLEQQEGLAKNLQQKLDNSDAKVFSLQKEVKVLVQKNQEMNSYSGIQSALASGMATPSMNGTLTNISGSSHDLPKSPSKSKIEVERSKLIRYAKELRKRVQDRDGKIEELHNLMEDKTNQVKNLEEEKVKSQNILEEQADRYDTEIKSLTASISRANSETMHYKRDLESIKMEFSTVTKMLLASDNPREVRSATGVECIDEMVQKLTSRFMIKPVPKETSDSGTNTSFEENQENVENLEFSMNSGVESEKEDEEIITPRMMQDITNTMESPRVTPKGSPSKILKPGFKSGRPLNTVVVPVISKFDNPSLTQDINEIIKREEGFTKILETRREHFNQNRQDHDRQNHNDHQPGNENVHVNILENINENPVQVSAAGENFTKIKHFDIDGNMSILEEYEKNEDEEYEKLDRILQGHIDDFLKETAGFME